ncbi:hypothetical protein LNKW23_00230 [Paralimibaculum aggregatum]|uniref:Glycosyltransferase subfamily 4-like N-terminal domain-containing protein n=1 Tax=Paralimibaculum aggregatum TaxID=3036245 RepID=A0ABQ6LK78_9RHOB|nr:glycosyltransferase family 4 protein [Limibaculum sp. NKW23]GMG80811.1 hypothetical protein LNKW23_00230 [Limibaculum sp. NKW23]
MLRLLRRRAADTNPAAIAEAAPPGAAGPAEAAPAEDTPAAEPGAPLFDAAWYAGHAVDRAVEPRADYLERGSQAARSPCPLFSPAWYRARYRDVALAGGEPLEHWLAHGWREGRDPSGLFCTAAYLAACPELAGGDRDPLSHWLAEGRAAGIRPHPKVAAFDPGQPDIALAMPYLGDRTALDLALWALAQGRAGLPVTVYLTDAGDEPARGELDALAEAVAARGDGLEVRRHCVPGGDALALANAGLWAAQQAGRHSHVGLLEQAALLPRGALRGLVDLWAPVAAPVLNLAETVQAVPVDFDIYASSEPLAALEGFAARRRALIPGAVTEAAALEPACLLFEAGALEALGLLDESAPDLRQALGRLLAGMDGLGLAPPVVARHIYAHRLERTSIAGAAPGDPVAAALAAATAEAADAAALGCWTADAPRLLAAHAARREAGAAALGRELRRLHTRLGRLETASPAESRGLADAAALCPWDEVAFGAAPQPVSLADPAGLRAAYRRVQDALWAELIARDRASLADVLGMQPVAAALARIFAAADPVLVLTMDTDPVTGDEKDGYVQRVVAIDKALAPRDRLYLKMVEARAGRPALVFLDTGIWRLEIAHRDPLGEAVLAALLGLGACVYSQSLVGIDPPVLRRLLPARRGRLIMDMHGAVPEEFVLYENHYMAQKYAGYEAWAAREADLVVCVTDAMAAHFAEKLGLAPERMIVCPIYTHSGPAQLPARPYNARPRAIYAGGTQRWQCIPELAAAVAATVEEIDWCLLTPDPEGMARALRRAGVEEGAPGLSLRAAAQAQVFATYQRCDFGLLLREDCTVNRVACPTKLIEYLRFGVIPVLDTPHVGDFAAMGMRYLDAAAFREGRLPGPDARAEMAAANHAVFRSLLARSRAGLGQIAAAVAEAGPAAAAPQRIRSTA